MAVFVAAVAAAVAPVGVAAATATAGFVSAAVVTEVLTGVVVGAAIGAAGAAITGGDIGKGALIGGITGGIASGVSVAMNGVSASAANAANSAAGLGAGAEGAAVAGQTGNLFSSAAQTGTAQAAGASNLTKNLAGPYKPSFLQEGAEKGLLLKAPQVGPAAPAAAVPNGVNPTGSGGFDMQSWLEHDTKQRALDRVATDAATTKQMLYGATSEGVKGLLAPDPIKQIEQERNLDLRNAKEVNEMNKIGDGAGIAAASATAKFTDDPVWLQQFNDGLLNKA
ncbi:MAG: hypothetical protein OEV91_09530 [Desulfobulbaceae bacterium]|nr:hypothetical protein [Desulfobulbaceae bacterium]